MTTGTFFGGNYIPDLDSTIAALLDAGASVLPFGTQRPLTSIFKVPDSASKCVEIDACSEAQVQAALQEFRSETCASSFLLLWRLQEKQAAAAAGKPKEPQPAEQ
uniref:Uncharacterized protein n=1 Tax=Tetradesmus obliquus TaxID=3088 RepID=A0A383VYS8_TETOB|eukprot:jgi/Sobl393_1/16758/SZX70615.1